MLSLLMTILPEDAEWMEGFMGRSNCWLHPKPMDNIKEEKCMAEILLMAQIMSLGLII